MTDPSSPRAQLLKEAADRLEQDAEGFRGISMDLEADAIEACARAVREAAAALADPQPEKQTQRWWKECGQCGAEYPPDTEGESRCCNDMLLTCMEPIKVADPSPQWQPRAEKAEAAIRAFLVQWAIVEPHINGQFVLAQVRSGCQYTGPTIAKELDRLRAALPDPPPEAP